MNKLFRSIPLFSLLFLALFSSSGCSVVDAFPLPPPLPPYPTLTPYPTDTPFPTPTLSPPTATPIADQWEVKIISATKSLVFGGLLYTETMNMEFLIVTIEYTNLRQETIEFHPGSLVLVYPDGSSYPGYSQIVNVSQAEGASVVIDLVKEIPPIIYAKPGQT